MFVSVLIRSLFILGFTLLPLILVNLVILEEITTQTRSLYSHRSREEALRDARGMRYGFLIVTGSVALGIMLTLNGAL